MRCIGREPRKDLAGVDKLLDMTKVKLICVGTSISFLVIHIAMLVLFTRCGVVPMARLNVLSVAFYVAEFLVIHKKWLRAFCVSVYLEVIVHMSAAVLCVGWDSGFQVTLIGMNVLAFFAEYVGRATHIRHISGLGFSILGMCAYLALLEVSHYHPAPYSLPDEVSFWLQIGWGIIVFGITITVLQLFVLVVFNSEDLLSKQLSHDLLTGLPNRYYMMDYLKESTRSEDVDGLWVAMADIDDFKLVNDAHGHNCGDYVLKAIASILNEVGEDVEVCRWGGEEFLLVGRLGEGETDVADAACLHSLRTMVADHSFWYGEQRLGLTMTIGVARHERGETISEWINRADKKLYEGKANGKNQVVA